MYNIVLHPKMHIRHLNISHPKILVVIWMSTFTFSINQCKCVSRCSTSNCNYLRLCLHRLRNRLRLSHSLYVSFYFSLFLIIIIFFFYFLWLSHRVWTGFNLLFSSVIITLRVRTSFCLLFSLFLFLFLLCCRIFCSSFFLLFASFSLKYLHLFINMYYTWFFKCTLNIVLDKCTWYLTKQHWGIVLLYKVWGIIRN